MNFTDEWVEHQVRGLCGIWCYCELAVVQARGDVGKMGVEHDDGMACGALVWGFWK
jgi:hypothetical protein